MFIWFGTQQKARKVPNGRRLQAWCAECRKATDFVEVEIEEKLSVYSVVDLLEDKERGFRCVECGALAQILAGDEGPAARAARQEEERAEQARRREAREAEAEQALRALKARMGPTRRHEPFWRRWLRWLAARWRAVTLRG